MGSTAFLAICLVLGGAVFARLLMSDRQAYGAMADFLNWAFVTAPGTVVCKDGSLIAGWEVEGLDTESLEPAHLDGLLQRVAKGVASMPEGATFWMRVERRPFAGLTWDSANAHGPGATRFLDLMAHENFGSETLFRNVLHLCVQCPPDQDAQTAEQVTLSFNRQMDSFETRLGSALRLKRLGVNPIQRAMEQDVKTDGLVDLLATGLSGMSRRVRWPDAQETLYLDSLLAVDVEQENLNEFIRVDGRVCAVLSIEGLPAEYPPEALAQLEALDMEYVWVSRFSPQSRARTRATVRELRKQWRQSAAHVQSQITGEGGGDRDSYADTMAFEIEEANYDVSRGAAVYGAFSSTLLIFGQPNETEMDLRRRLDAVVSVVLDVGFSVRAERHAAFETLLSTLPGHAHRAPRDVYVSNLNFAELMPIRTFWKGEEYCPSPLFPKKSPSLMLGRTSSGELFRFNLHYGDVGHTMIFGPTSGGKSVLLGAIAGHFLKYPGAQVVFFDKRGSVRKASQVFEGSFNDFGTGKGVAPMSDVGVLGREWAIRWLFQAFEGAGLALSGAQRAEISSCVDNMLASKESSLEAVHDYLTDPSLHQIVGELLKSVVNKPEEEVVWSPFTVFETHELFEQDESTAVLVLDYLFASVEKRFTGQPTLIVIDEAWAFLGHPIFAERIRSWLKEARKANVAVVLATQSLADVVDTPITPVLLESCYTKIFLPNAGAKTQASSEQYKALGLNDAQIDLISGLVPKKDYYLIKPGVARVIDFAFDPATLKLIGQTSVRESKAAAEAYAVNPRYWEADIFGLLELEGGGQAAAASAAGKGGDDA